MKHIFLVIFLFALWMVVPENLSAISYHSPSLASEPTATIQNIGLRNISGSSIRKEMQQKRYSVNTSNASTQQFNIAGGRIYSTATSTSKSYNGGSQNFAQGYAAARNAISGANTDIQISTVASAVPSAQRYYSQAEIIAAIKRYKPTPGLGWGTTLDEWAEEGDTDGNTYWEYKDGEYWYYTEEGLRELYERIFTNNGDAPDNMTWEEFLSWFLDNQGDSNFLHRLPIGNGTWAMIIMATLYTLLIFTKKTKQTK